MKFRFWLNVLTLLLLAFAVYLARDQIVQAWGLMSGVDLRIFLLLIPIQLISYYTEGEVMFSYLKARGDLKLVNGWQTARIALEINFINHIIPVPSIAGFSYLGWILKKKGVSMARSTMAQVIKYALIFITFVALILISVFILILDHQVSRSAIFVSALFVFITIIATSLLIYAISRKTRVKKLAAWTTSTSNKIVDKLTFGRKKQILNIKQVDNFFVEMHEDYLEIKKEKKILHKPIIWAVLANVSDVALVWVAFLSLGYVVNPAALFIGFGVASFTAIFAATPGGSGAYEAVMIAFLVSAGVPPSVAIAGTLLARVTLFAGTIIFGYVFYQLTINKYGEVSEE